MTSFISSTCDTSRHLAITGIHAREWISPAAVTYVLNSLVEDPDYNSDILDVFDVYVLPVSNPDG